jgi:hypothetical protein
MFMTAWVFEARHCPTLLNEIKKTKLDSNAEPQAGINIFVIGRSSFRQGCLYEGFSNCLRKSVGVCSVYFLNIRPK